MSKTTSIRFKYDDDDRENLNVSLPVCDVSRLFNLWTNTGRLAFDSVELILDSEAIDPHTIDLMVKFLNLPFAQNPTGNGDEEVRWIDVTFLSCDIAERCQFGDLDKLFSTIANRTRRLEFLWSPELVSRFLVTPGVEHFAVQRLFISLDDSLSVEEYTILGSLIASYHIQLIELDLNLLFAEGAHVLLFGLADAINLEELSFHNTNNQAGLLTEGIDPLLQLLQNPQNRLKKLTLMNLGLQDQHLIAISQVLPACQIEYFDFSNNVIGSAGILEFARNLPRMHSLNHILFNPNRWTESETACNTFGNALLQHAMENTCMESVDNLDCFPQGRLLWHYLVVNRAGRRLLTSHSIPDGLWPLVLKRASDKKTYFDNDILSGRSKARYNAVYFLLQSFPKMLSFRSGAV